MLDKIGGVLRTAAPGIATALGGPLAGVAVHTLSNAIFGKGDAAEAGIVQAVASGNPDILLKIKEAEVNFQTRMRELEIDLERIHQEDRADARAFSAALTGSRMAVSASRSWV